MVKEDIITKYKCPYCDSVYDNESRAEDCAEDCMDIEPPVEIEESVYYCEMCNGKYEEYDEAKNCEEQHLENNDMKYAEYLCKKEMESLQKASEHKEQTRLKIWEK